MIIKFWAHEDHSSVLFISLIRYPKFSKALSLMKLSCELNAGDQAVFKNISIILRVIK